MYEKYLKTINDNSGMLCAVSDALWEHPETAYREYTACRILTDTLEQQGFAVTRGTAGIPTAFTATFGTGKPHLGILAEYDALAGLSQQGMAVEPRPLPGMDCGHGCGHNLFASGSLAAALAVKAFIEDNGKGSISLFGCPAEEGGGGKVFMAREGVFQNIDAVVSWHPECMYMVRTRPSLAINEILFRFEGIASHAGAAPEKGRSALDAVELMNVGANFLREHMDLTSRVHYAILDAGDRAPNVVQSHAEVLYYVRAVDAETTRELQERVIRVAKGAALMTDTEMTYRIVSGYGNLITIPTLQAVANEAMHSIPVPVPTEEETAFGKALQKTMMLSEEQRALPPFAENVLDPTPPKPHGGSTDTADVSWNCPTVQMHIGTWVAGTPGHSWQAVSQNRGTYAKRAMLYAGKAVAGTLFRLFDRPELIDQAKREHAAKTPGGYVCAIPADVKPAIRPAP